MVERFHHIVQRTMKKQVRQKSIDIVVNEVSKPTFKPKSNYVAIEKQLLTHGQQITFDLFVPDGRKTQMTPFLQTDTVIDGNMKVRLREIEELYISEEDMERYLSYKEQHLQHIAKDENIPVDTKAKILYEVAVDVIDDLYHNPQALENFERGEQVVSAIVGAILSEEQTIKSLMKVTAHDYYTHTHSLNVSVYALSFGAFLKLSEEQLQWLGSSALLHDIGKSRVDYNIINKNGPLSDEEYDAMKVHPAAGHEIAVDLGITNPHILDGIRYHHEKLNGLGYPDGLEDSKITVFPRIIAICDVFDALTTKRSYKDPMSSFEALGLMKQSMKGHLDMKMIDRFIRMLAG